MRLKRRLLYEMTADQAVPYGPVVNRHGVIRLNDHSHLAMFRVTGRAWESADQEDIDGWSASLNTFARNIASDRLSLSTHIVRTRARSPYPVGTFRSGFAAKLDETYRAQLESQLYENQMFLSVLRRPAELRGFMESSDDIMRHLEDALSFIASELRPYGLRRLGLREGKRGLYVEAAEALALVLTGQHIKAPLTSGRLGRVIHHDRIIFGNRDTIEFRAEPSYYGAALGLKEYPAQSFPGHFDKLLHVPYYFSLTQSFAFLRKQDGMKVFKRKQNQMVSADDPAFSQIADLILAADKLQSNEFVVGSHHLSMTVFADSVNNLHQVVAQARSDLADSGAVVAREDLGMEGSFWSHLPGNEKLRPRPGAITSLNWADMNGMHGYPSGAVTGHWGPPVARFRTAAATAYDMQLHIGDLGNIFMCGPSGSGKTTLLLFLLAMAEKYDPTTVLFDYGRGGEIFTRAVGGSYLVAPTGENTGWAPLRGLTDTTEDIAFLCEWVRGLIVRDGYEVKPEDERRIHRAVTMQMGLLPEMRSLAELRAALGQRDVAGAGARLNKWCAGAGLGWAFDGPEDLTDLSGMFVGYDMTAVLDDPAIRGPAMAYMFHRIESLLDGRRLVLAFDEFWKPLLDPEFRDMVHEKLKTIRKRNGVVILSTQSPRDALNSPIAHTIIEQCPTQIFLPNGKATREDYIAGMKLTETEFRLVKSDMMSRQFLLKQGNVSVTCSLDLSNAQDCIAVLSGRDNTVRLMEGLIRDAGADPELWLDRFMASAQEEVS